VVYRSRGPGFYSQRYHNFRVLGLERGLLGLVSAIVELKKLPWPESASELYRPIDHHLLAKLVPPFVDRGCHVVSVTDAYGHILRYLDRGRYFFFQVAPQLYSRG
jgi:hypothetical protein